jgi:hypothetical protein
MVRTWLKQSSENWSPLKTLYASGSPRHRAGRRAPSTASSSARRCGSVRPLLEELEGRTLPSITGGVAGYYATQDNYQHVIVGTNDGNVNELYFQPGRGVGQDVLWHFGSGVVGVAGYYTTQDNYQHVMVGTGDGNVNELYFRPGQGVGQDVLWNFGASGPSAPSTPRGADPLPRSAVEWTPIASAALTDEVLAAWFAREGSLRPWQPVARVA